MAKIRFKRSFDRSLSEGLGSQLLWLLCAGVLAFLLLFGIGAILYPGPEFTWQNIMELYLDPGNFSGDGRHDLFKLLVVFAGLLLLSTLLISAFNNLFDNIIDHVRTGTRRYKLKEHILFLGAGRELIPVLRKLKTTDKEIAVMTGDDVEALRTRLEIEIDDDSFVKSLYLYHGDRDVMKDLERACAQSASVIYLIGNDEENGHDAKNLSSYQLLRELCDRKSVPGTTARCYVSMENDASMDLVLGVSEPMSTPHLKTDFVCAEDNVAEQLLAQKDFLPVITRESDATPHIVILGTGPLTDRLGVVASQICHYPDYADGRMRRTLISIVAPGMKDWYEDFTASKRNYFELSTYSYISPEGAATLHTPDAAYGDFLDIEWEFIDCNLSSPMLDSMMKEWSRNASGLRLIISLDSQEATETALLNLPSEMQNVPKAIYVSRNPALTELAARSGRYGDITLFGPGAPDYNPLFESRADAGRIVNDFYEQTYGQKRTSDDAWYGIQEAHKVSSIYCNYAMPLRRKCFGRDAADKELFECEHRRWMATALMTGYRAMTPEQIAQTRKEKKVKEYKKRFLHVDIVPFDDLPKDEQDKDRLLIDNIYRNE